MAQDQKLNAEDRRQKILELLMTDGKLHGGELSALFGVSDVSIRNDLIAMEREGLLQRTHGGAIPPPMTQSSQNYQERRSRNTEEKRQIARVIAGMITNGETLFINSGTTTFFVAEELKRLQGLTIVTNSILLAMEFGELPNFHIILLGGNIDARHSFTFGDDATAQLKKYRADKLILSIDGVSLEKGLTTYYFQETTVNQMMLERVDQTIVAADYTKIGAESFSYVAPANAVDALVTNPGGNEQELLKLKESGINVTLA